MRAGPLSETPVISLLNSSFVPVYVSNEDYRGSGAAPADERAEYHRIFAEFGNKIGDFTKERCSVGTVHVYIMDPSGQAMDSLHVAIAAQKGRLLQLLKETVAKLQTPPGKTVVQPAVQSAPPTVRPDQVLFHLTARGDGTGPNGGSWREFPSENWIVLDRWEWTKLLPPTRATAGQTWNIDPEVAARVLRYFYPQSEEGDSSDVRDNRIDSSALSAKIVSLQGTAARAMLTGSLRMKHNFYPGKQDNNYVSASVVGYLDFDIAKDQIQALRLVTENATYGKGGFAVAVLSVPPPAVIAASRESVKPVS